MIYLIQGIAKRLVTNRQQSTLTSVNLLPNLVTLNWRFLDEDQNKLTIFSYGLFRILFFNSCKYMILFHKIKHFIPSQLYLHLFLLIKTIIRFSQNFESIGIFTLSSQYQFSTWQLYTILLCDVNSCMQEGIFTIRNPMDKRFISKTSTKQFRHGDVSGTFVNVFDSSLIRL